MSAKSRHVGQGTTKHFDGPAFSVDPHLTNITESKQVFQSLIDRRLLIGLIHFDSANAGRIVRGDI